MIFFTHIGAAAEIYGWNGIFLVSRFIEREGMTRINSIVSSGIVMGSKVERRKMKFGNEWKR